MSTGTTKPRHYKHIYVLRAQCHIHGLDKMVSFYRVPNASAKAMFEGHEKDMIERFSGKYECDHPIQFTRETDRNYYWDTKLNKAVKKG